MLPLLRPVRGKKKRKRKRENNARWRGRKVPLVAGSAHGVQVHFRRLSARFDASLPGLPPLRPSLPAVSKMPKSCARVNPLPCPSLHKHLAKSPVLSVESRFLEASLPPPPAPVLPRLPTVRKEALARVSSATRCVRYCSVFCFDRIQSDAFCFLLLPSPVVLLIFRS